MAAGTAEGVAVENRLAALNAGAGGLVSGAFDRGARSREGRLIDRPGSGLGHDHAADGQSTSWRCRARLTLRAMMRWSGSGRGLRRNRDGWRFCLRCGCQCF
jgi:hypothetical protein